jgi:hypothetical protein
MKLYPKEPEFSVSTILLGESIAEQLIESSRRCRPKWSELFQEHRSAIPELTLAVRSKSHTIHHPLVSGFMLEWARNATWGTCPSEYRDAIGVNVPSIHLERLAAFGGIEAFSFMLGDLADFCSASLGHNDHNREFGLILNCPAWLELASHEEFQSSLSRQIQMVVQHEMAHFRHQNDGIRSETHAHCRGISSVLCREKPPTSIEQFIAIIHEQFPEITDNDEVRNLVLDKGQTPWRLVRLWLHLFRKHSERS